MEKINKNLSLKLLNKLFLVITKRGLTTIETININEGYYAHPKKLMEEMNHLILSVSSLSELENVCDDVKKAQNVDDQPKMEKINGDKIVNLIQKDLVDMTDTYNAELQKSQRKEQGALTETLLKEAACEIDNKTNELNRGSQEIKKIHLAR